MHGRNTYCRKVGIETQREGKKIGNGGQWLKPTEEAKRYTHKVTP